MKKYVMIMITVIQKCLRETKKTLKYNHGEKSLKVLFIIYIDTECSLKRQHSYPNNLQKSYTERKAKHEPSGWAVTVKCLFDAAKSKHDYYREIDCMKKMCEN